ncbi:hypothetical protein DL769_001737 [Monosporascus sp. CRB-8-3]|nr:hypothetical protein DL769_001737 [Monosporascus sp. CRB-8-3]
MKISPTTVITCLSGLQGTYAWSWQFSTWSGWGATGDLTGAYLVPETPSVGVCPETEKFCISFDNSHSVTAIHTTQEDYTTLYIQAFTGTDCSGDWTSYSVEATAQFDIDTGGPVRSLALMAGLCGSPW